MTLPASRQLAIPYLTARQIDVLTFVLRYASHRRGKMPKAREIADGLGLRSEAWVCEQLRVLRACGLLPPMQRRNRLRVTRAGRDVLAKHAFIPERRCQVCRCAVFTQEGCPMCRMRGAA